MSAWLAVPWLLLAGVTGQMERHPAFASTWVAPRHVDVWLPPGYATASERYPVLYMHDGQSAFDPATAFGGTDWGVDETLTRLIRKRKVRPAIVVAVWNTDRRSAEYMPLKAVPGATIEAVPNAPPGARGPLISDAYLRFLVEELKPFVDATYRTLPGREDTFVMGSSMGGLISLYAISEYPEVFGGAACVSTHWPAGDGIVIDFFRTRLPDPASHRLYFDFGTATLDAGYEPFQRRMDAAVRAAGYRKGRNWSTRKFVGADHSERSWRRRVDVPLEFLLGWPRPVAGRSRR